jgi:hypothetical protein
LEITPEEIEKFRVQFEEQQIIGRELSKKEEVYKERTTNNNLNLELKWQDKITDIDKDFLFSKVKIDGFDNFEENFTVEYLNIDRILNYHCENDEQVFPRNELWNTCRCDRKITKLISYIEEGNTLCPPIIDFTFVQLTNSEVFALYDGNHRIALSRFLKNEKIPFIIRKTNLERIKNI